MSTRAKVLLVVAAMIASLAALTWYSNLESQRWNVAQEHDTAEFYERYMQDFPEGAHAEGAQRRIAELRGLERQAQASRTETGDDAPQPLQLVNMQQHVAQFVTESGIKFAPSGRDSVVSLKDLESRKTFAPEVLDSGPFPPPFVLYGADRSDDHLRRLPYEFTRWHVTESLEHAATAVFIDGAGTEIIRICLIDLSDPDRVSVMSGADLPQEEKASDGSSNPPNGDRTAAEVLESLLRRAMEGSPTEGR